MDILNLSTVAKDWEHVMFDTPEKRYRFYWAMAKQIIYTKTIKPFVIINN
jgi:hypothetical protein